MTTLAPIRARPSGQFAHDPGVTGDAICRPLQTSPLFLMCAAARAVTRSERHRARKGMDDSKKDLTFNACAEPAIMSRAEPSRAEPSRAEPSRAEPSRAEPSRAEPSRAEPSRAEPSRAEPSRAEPSRAEPSRAEPSRAEPSRAEPSRAEPSRAEPSVGSCLSSTSPPECSAAPAPARPSDAPSPSGRARHTRSAAPVRARDRDRSLRPARPGRTAATVLVLGLLLLGAAAAEAQTSRILVSNTGQTADDSANTSGNDHAQLFHTGANTAGYTLTQRGRQLRRRPGRRLRRRGLRGGYHRERVSHHDLHGPDGAGELRGLGNVIVHARRPRPLGEHQLRGGDHAARHRERGARLHHLRRRRFVSSASRTGASRTSSTGRAAVPGC